MVDRLGIGMLLIAVCLLTPASCWAQSNQTAPAVPWGPLITDQEFGATSVKSVGPYGLGAPKGFGADVDTPFDLVQVARNSNDGPSDVPPPWAGNVDGGFDIHTPVVIVSVYPNARESTESHWNQIMSNLMHQDPAVPDYVYRNSFVDMQLFHGGVLVQPLVAHVIGVIPTADTADGTHEVGDAKEGVYFYDPSVFDPAEPITIKMRQALKNAGWEDVKMDPKVQERIWDQFAGYRADLVSLALVKDGVAR